MTQVPTDITPGDSFDYIIVGGGTAGCALAARLTENSNHTVLMLEAGGRDNGFWIRIPAGFTKLLTNPKYNWLFQTEPEENVLGRTLVVPRGKGLGGSSSINGMVFVRGQPQDFDRWKSLGAAGWGFDDVLPYFKKLEHFGNDGDVTRGHDGPVRVERVAKGHEIPEAFLLAAQQTDFAINPDYNGPKQDGFGWYQVTQHRGRRWSATDAYLWPSTSRPNLVVRTNAHVIRVNFDGRRAAGVTYRLGDREIHVTARAEVILAAGAVQSPQLMELSGIGRPESLGKAGIPVFHESPGVGENYYDHYATRMNWRVKVPITLNELTRGWRLGAAVAQYFLTRKGILTLGTGVVHGFVRTKSELTSPDVQYFFVHASYGDASTRALDSAPGMTIGVSQLRPESKGSIHVKSPDPFTAPAIRPNFLSSQVDQDALVEGMRIARKIVEQPAMDKYRAYEISPGPATDTSAEWLEFARSNGQTIYHPVGTCAMGNGVEAVVDERLKVRGIDGLRIVDASVMPTIVSGNTAAAVMMIAEKGADLIKADVRR